MHIVVMLLTFEVLECYKEGVSSEVIWPYWDPPLRSGCRPDHGGGAPAMSTRGVHFPNTGTIRVSGRVRLRQSPRFGPISDGTGRET